MNAKKAKTLRKTAKRFHENWRFFYKYWKWQFKEGLIKVPNHKTTFRKGEGSPPPTVGQGSDPFSEPGTQG